MNGRRVAFMVARGDKVSVPAVVSSMNSDEMHYSVTWDYGYECLAPESSLTTTDTLAADESTPLKKGQRVKATRSIGHMRKGDTGKVKATHGGPHYIVTLSTGGSAVVGSDVQKYDPDNDGDTDTSGKPDVDMLMPATDMQDALMVSRRRW